jgi:hypothetical protein
MVPYHMYHRRPMGIWRKRPSLSAPHGVCGRMANPNLVLVVPIFTVRLRNERANRPNNSSMYVGTVHIYDILGLTIYVGI